MMIKGGWKLIQSRNGTKLFSIEWNMKYYLWMLILTLQKDSDVQMTRRMEEVSQELRRAEARNDTLVNDKKKANGELTKANDALNNAQQEVSTLKSKLQELEKHLSATDNQKELETKLQVLCSYCL